MAKEKRKYPEKLLKEWENLCSATKKRVAKEKAEGTEVKKYYACYNEDEDGDAVDEIEVYCVASRIPRDHWYEMDEEQVKEYLEDGRKFTEY